MQTFTGRYLRGQSHFTADVEMPDVYACHCTLCQKWLDGTAMCLGASAHPLMSSESAEPSCFPSSNHGERFFCSGCRYPLWFMLTDNDRYSIPWTLLEFNEVDRRHLILTAEIYTETQPALWRLTG